MSRSPLRALAHLAFAVALGTAGVGVQAGALTFGTGSTLEVKPTEVVLPALPTALPKRTLEEASPVKVPTPFILSVRGPRPPKDDFLEALLKYAVVPGLTKLQISVVVPDDSASRGQFDGLVAQLESLVPDLKGDVSFNYFTPAQINCTTSSTPSSCDPLPTAADGGGIAYYFGLFDWADAHWAASPFVYSLVNTGAMLFLDARTFPADRVEIDPSFGGEPVTLAYAVKSFEVERTDSGLTGRFVGASQIPEPGSLALAAAALGALASLHRRRTT